jgi:hypothetical protein
MTAAPPQLIRCLAFITGRLAKASRDAQINPTKVHQQRVRSLEMLAAACVSEAARLAVRGPAAPRLDPEPPPFAPAEEMPEPRGVWTPPAG